MLEQSLIIALLVLSIWYTMQEGEIFGRGSSWIAGILPAKVHPAVFECNVCMTPWYGSVLYWLMPWTKLGMPESTVLFWPIVIIVGMAINIVINKWTPDKDDDPEKEVQVFYK